jgi:hypothetical protein
MASLFRHHIKPTLGKYQPCACDESFHMLVILNGQIIVSEADHVLVPTLPACFGERDFNHSAIGRSRKGPEVAAIDV